MNKNQERSQRPYCGSVENFLEIGKSQEKVEEFKNPWEYDFKYEYSNGNLDKYWNLDEEKDIIKRLLKYKANYKAANSNGFDCDGSGEKYTCKLSRDIYRRLWGWNDQQKRYGTIGSCSISAYGPDTMNSFLTLFCSALNEQNRKIAGKAKRININFSFLYNLLIEQKKRTKDFLNDKSEQWKNYAETSHVIGNFVLVPAGFNPKRSNMFKDFWDLSLLYLKGQVKDNIWLSSSNLFVKYINYFFLWDYVICNEKQPDYYVKSMLLNSDIFMSVNEYRSDLLVSPDRQMPNKTEISNFIENAQWAVKRRGIFMTAMLRLQSEKSDEYDRLRSEIFAADKCYNGYKKVIEKISKKIALPSTVKDILREEPEWAEIKELQKTQEKDVNE